MDETRTSSGIVRKSTKVQTPHPPRWGPQSRQGLSFSMTMTEPTPKGSLPTSVSSNVSHPARVSLGSCVASLTSCRRFQYNLGSFLVFSRRIEKSERTYRLTEKNCVQKFFHFNYLCNGRLNDISGRPESSCFSVRAVTLLRRPRSLLFRRTPSPTVVM